MDDKFTRRAFLESTPVVVGAVAAFSGAGLARARSVSASDKLALFGGTPVRRHPFPETWPIYDQNEEQALLDVLHSRDWCSLRGHWVYDFEKTFNEHFGVIKQKRFTVKAELTGWAAGFTAERKLSPDQKIVRRKGGKIVITYSATSAPEVLNWVLSLGAEAKLVEPEWLVGELRERLVGVGALYG